MLRMLLVPYLYMNKSTLSSLAVPVVVLVLVGAAVAWGMGVFTEEMGSAPIYGIVVFFLRRMSPPKQRQELVPVSHDANATLYFQYGAPGTRTVTGKKYRA